MAALPLGAAARRGGGGGCAGDARAACAPGKAINCNCNDYASVRMPLMGPPSYDTWQGADLRYADVKGYTALHHAVANNHEDAALYLLTVRRCESLMTTHEQSSSTQH